ncbi:3-isopropylmalate dehydrogenase [Austwickia chelonae]|uniref:3-isopropylmalate dehydrogenase n=1 Tax=Austwickia chelonae TaxID=100225 RepID=UPI000E2639CB|nr:3-isopropylmalate dehydrogenase [Austwickia chelonae]
MKDVAQDTIELACIPGDGIGPEVVREARSVLDALAGSGIGPRIDVTEYDLGARRWKETGEALPAGVLRELRDHDAILLGAIGDPSVPSGLLERQLLLALRFALDHYVNLRPVKLLPGGTTPLDLAQVAPEGIDYVVVREGTEGPYVGNGGALRVGTPAEIATETSINTRHGVERVVRYAFDTARGRSRRHLTLVHKHNVLTHAGQLWRRTVEEVAADYPEVEWGYQHVDAATIFMVTDPGRFDVIVTDNLFGDIITDLAGATAGGIGLAASGNINPTRSTPSMFEPVHGSAPDIAGQGKADPTATILSAAMMLTHLGYPEASAAIETAVAADLAARPRLGTRCTSDIGESVVRLLT